jgi:hypothetical protein
MQTASDTIEMIALVKAFNTVLREMVILFRTESNCSEVKSAIKRDYKKFDSDTDAHIAAFRENDDQLSGFPLLKTASEFVDSGATEQVFRMHECLRCLAKLHTHEPADCIVNVVLNAMATGDATDVPGAVLDKDLASELSAMITSMDEDLRALLPNVKPAGHDIMSIARDVSKTIDIESIMRDGMDPNSAAVQDMFSNVTRDIQGRIDNGQVDQDALMQEASAMLAGLGGAGGMGAMLQALMSGQQSTPKKSRRR